MREVPNSLIAVIKVSLKIHFMQEAYHSEIMKNLERNQSKLLSSNVLRCSPMHVQNSSVCGTFSVLVWMQGNLYVWTVFLRKTLGFVIICEFIHNGFTNSEIDFIYKNHTFR